MNECNFTKINKHNFTKITKIVKNNNINKLANVHETKQKAPLISDAGGTLSTF